MFEFLNSKLIFFSFKVGQDLKQKTLKKKSKKEEKTKKKKTPGAAAATFPGVNSGNARCKLIFVTEELFKFSCGVETCSDRLSLAR